MIKQIGWLSLLLALGACNDNSESDRGQFLDSAVEGISYRTDGTQGMTEADGGFEYYGRNGGSVTFSIGSVQLGFSQAAPVLTPKDLHLAAPSESMSTDFGLNVAQFLQSIDNDGNPANGIQITQAMHDLATDREITFRQSPESFADDGAVQILVADLTATRPIGAGGLVDRQGATDHMIDTVENVLADISADLTGTVGDAACTEDTQCRTVPIGYRACGGPAWYLPYSTNNTSRPELEPIAIQHRRHHRTLVSLRELLSTCEVLQEPTAMCVAGQCTAENVYPSPL